MPRDSTSVILYRRRPQIEVFLVERSPELEFFGGYLAFAGGRVERADALVPVDGAEGIDPALRAAIGCGLRELFEETGILATRGGSLPRSDALELRDRLLRGDGADVFFETLRQRRLVAERGDWIEAGRLITPRFSRIRYDTRFFLLRTDEDPEIRDGELSGGSWRTPTDALAAWHRGECLVTPPALVVLRSLVAHSSLSRATAELRAIEPEFEGSGHAIPWGPGIDLVPLTTPPLPPSIPTTTFIVGHRRVFVIDPAPSDTTGQRHLERVLEARLDRGDRLAAILLSHHHVDHVGALDRVARGFSLPVWAHRRTAELLGRDVEHELGDDEILQLDESPDGRPGWTLRCLFTPGHAEGHLTFHDERYGALIAGDLLSTIVSMYVGSPGGHLATYFASLERIRALPLRTLYPSHGPPTLHARSLIDRTLEHRRERLEQVLRILAEREGSVSEVAERVYGSEIDSRLRPLFERTTRAALEHLAESARAEQIGEDRYRARRPGVDTRPKPVR